jgi:hypothetical protein
MEKKVNKTGNKSEIPRGTQMDNYPIRLVNVPEMDSSVRFMAMSA